MKRFGLIGLFIIFIVGLWGTGANAKTFVLSTTSSYSAIPSSGVTPDSGGTSPFVVDGRTSGNTNIMAGTDDEYCAVCLEVSAVTFAQGPRGHTDASNSTSSASPFNVYYKTANKPNPTNDEWTTKKKNWIWKGMHMNSEVSPFARCVKIPPVQLIRFYLDHVSGATEVEYVELKGTLSELPSDWKEEPLSLGYTESAFGKAGTTNFTAAAAYINGAGCIEIQPVGGVSIYYTPDGALAEGTTPSSSSKAVPDGTIEQLQPYEYISGEFAVGGIATGTLNIEQFTICPER